MNTHIPIEKLEVNWDKLNRRFFFPQVGTKDAQLEYELIDDGDRQDPIVHITSVFVPPSMRSMGLGQHITQLALQELSEDNRRIKVSCPFVADYMRLNPVYNHLLIDA